MDRLVIGQNKSLGLSTKEFNVNYSSDLAIIAFSANGNQRFENKTLDLATLTKQGVTKVEFVVTKSGLFTSYTDSLPFVEIVTDVSAAVAIIGHLYRHNGEWRFRALNEIFNTLDSAQKYFQIQNIFSTTTSVQEVIHQTRENVQNAVSQARMVLQESGIEQAVRSGTNQAVEGAKKLANGLQQTFTQFMGNSDLVARQQTENDFKPMDMVKMQSVQFPPEITNLHLGLGWKSKSGTNLIKGFLTGNKTINVDLDLSVQILNHTGEVIDTVYFDKVRSDDHSIVHYGDAAQGGNGLQDNEIISVALNKLPSHATFIAVTVSSQKGHQFAGLENGYLRVVNQIGMIPLVQINLDVSETKTGALLGIFVLNNAKMWELVAISDYYLAKNIQELSPSILHWAKLIGQSRHIVPTNTNLLMG